MLALLGLAQAPSPSLVLATAGANEKLTKVRFGTVMVLWRYRPGSVCVRLIGHKGTLEVLLVQFGVLRCGARSVRY